MGFCGPTPRPNPMILVGVPFMKPHKKFLPHFAEWYAENKHRHDLQQHWEFYRPLHKAQRSFVNIGKRLGASHILFVEDDQFEFPKQGLSELLAHDKDVVGFATYKKSPPYFAMTMKKRDKNKSLINLRHEDEDETKLSPFVGYGLEEVDLIGFGFTLVKMSVFDRLEEAGLDPFEHWGYNPTDSYFCQYCEDVGIKKFANFNHVIGHGDIEPWQIPYYRKMHREMYEQPGEMPQDEARELQAMAKATEAA